MISIEFNTVCAVYVLLTMMFNFGAFLQTDRLATCSNNDIKPRQNIKPVDKTSQRSRFSLSNGKLLSQEYACIKLYH